VCQHCGGEKDMFIEMPENIQCMSSIASLTDPEEMHIPFYKKSGEKIIVQIGTEDNSHPIEDGHFLEYV